MPDANIAHRLRDFFARETAWLEETLEEYAAIEAEADFDIESLFAAVSRRSEPARAFEREYVALKREWDAADLDAGDRTAVETSAARAAALVEEMQRRIEKALARCAERGEAIQQELGTLRKGRAGMNHYKTGGDSPGYVDRKA